MRRVKDGQGALDFQPATLKLTDNYHKRYRRIDALLTEVPAILRRVHGDIRKVLERANRKRERRCESRSAKLSRVPLCVRSLCELTTATSCDASAVSATTG